MNADIKFFYKNAAVSSRPGAETEEQEQGRLRGAEDLAAAEAFARNAGVTFNWQQDEDEDEDEALWQCEAYDACGSMCGYLGGVDFGSGGSPHSDDYSRLVQAELAREYMDEVMESASK